MSSRFDRDKQTDTQKATEVTLKSYTLLDCVLLTTIKPVNNKKHIIHVMITTDSHKASQHNLHKQDKTTRIHLHAYILYTHVYVHTHIYIYMYIEREGSVNRLVKHIIKQQRLHSWTWNSDSRPLEPAPGRKFHEES